MATLQPLFRKSSQFSVTLRSFATTAKPSHHNDHKRNHKFLEPSSFIGSWEAPKDPKEAEARLAQLRRDYAKQVKEVRKAYIQEMELMRLEKQRKDDARREAIRVANEQRKKLKAEVAKVKAEERKIAQEEFRQTLLKERADKLETWRRMMGKHEEKKKEQKDLLHKQSSLWIDESELEEKILEAVVDTKLL
ncbi:LOW QUALITY PROTEIN: reticulocyte binding protein 2 homolog b-like [Neltuma alba]|uniref:reticulocyte binding protein 2 homolog b-like n=1 Tax=Neltuma alba TaxID=207710 RepID=UPI0010A40378|nr:reticulocyte binding protein 2 homolog b-like [Prosopis alba]XP_028804464.1 LOW QUALITY PROTEIN: reticulocyte binding protein 2 homolog b-like [Prosopis alba]